jgi:hypothetical protein
MNFKVILAAAALLASQSFAIIGIGGHYAPGFGTKMKAAGKAEVTKGIDFAHEGFDGTMQGFGFKLWIDLLPIFDIEATYNIQFGSYDASLYVNDPTGLKEPTEVPLQIELAGTPFGKANPKFVASNLDISITYPITFIPIIRPYIGGGFTYHLNSFVLNQNFVQGIIDEPAIADIIRSVASKEGLDPEALQQKAQELEALGQTLKQRVQDKAADEGLNTSIGGHVLVGTRAKLPIIPIAIYTNFKYYFGGDYPKEIDAGNMTLEVGGGFAL